MNKVVLTYEDYAALPDDGLRLVQPDLVYIDPERRRLLSERAIEGSPTLAIEVISPCSVRIDRRRKLALYAKHDVPWYWIADPVARTIEVHHLEEGAYRLVALLEGEPPRALPPLDDLPLDPAAVWR